MSTLNLSVVNTDQSDIKTQMEEYLLTQEGWAGNVYSQTGQGIISLVAAIGTMNAAKIRRKFQDSFQETVVNDSAAYALSTYQGVRLTRKLPAAVLATVTSAGVAQTIPAYTQFQGSGGFFFNRDAVFLSADTPSTVELYEGKVQRYVMNGLDQDFAMFVSMETGFQVSDLDTQVLINSAPMVRSTGGMWTLEGQLGFVDTTLPDGKLLVQFGNTYFGGRPSANDVLQITYVTTYGLDGNTLECIGKNFTCPNYPSISGVFQANPVGGANQRSALAYKNVAAPTFGTFNSAITKQQHITSAMEYPGVVDVVPFAQREVNPSALEWMNLIKLVLLTSSPWSQQQEEDFIQYMQSQSAYSPRFFLEYPTQHPVDIDMEVYCYNWSNSTQAKANAIAALQNLFVPRLGLLNYDLHRSDLIDTAVQADPGIEYVVLRNPTSDILIGGKPVRKPELTLMPGAGTLPIDTYYYCIQATTPLGIIAAKNLASVKMLDNNGAIKITWTGVTNATSYQIYRKDTPGLWPRLLVSVPADQVLEFVDTGLATSSERPSPQNTVPVRYVTLNSLKVTDFYSTRSLRG